MEDLRLGCGLSTENAESESAISIGWVRPYPHYIPDTPRRKYKFRQKCYVQREIAEDEDEDEDLICMT